MAMIPAILIYSWGGKYQHIDAGVQQFVAFGERHRHILRFVEWVLYRDSPLPDQAAARWIIIPPVIPGLDRLVQVQAVQSECQFMSIYVADKYSGGVVSVLGADLPRHQELCLWLQGIGAETNGHALPGLVPIRVLDVGADFDLIIG